MEDLSFTPEERRLLAQIGAVLLSQAGDLLRDIDEELQALDWEPPAPLTREKLLQINRPGILGFLGSLRDGTLESFAEQFAAEVLPRLGATAARFQQVSSSLAFAHSRLGQRVAEGYAGQPEFALALRAMVKASQFVQTLLARAVIAERDLALADVQRSEQLLRSIVNATPDWIFIKDQQHRFRMVNRSYAQAFHLQPEEFLGKNNLEVGFPEELVKGNPEKGIRGLWTDDRQVLDSGEPLLIPRDLVAIDGQLHLFDTIKVPLRDAEGRVWGLLGFARDMTELKRAEEELRSYRDQLEELVAKRTAELTRANERLQQEVAERQRAEERIKENERFLEAVFEGIQDGISVLDKKLTIARVNRAMERLYPHSRPLAGKKCFHAYHGHDQPCGTCPTLRALATRTPQMNEIPLTGPAGTEGWLEVYAFPRYDEEGNPTHVIEYVRDVSERKRMEQYVLRTERLAAMGRLAAALAHEVNNPLQGIGSSLELALDFPLEEAEREEYLQTVRQEIERLMHLTSRVLDFARPPQVERRPTCAAEVVRHALTLAGKQLQHRHIQVDVDLPADLPPVLASADHLAQVFLNLIINAIDAMPGGGKLSVVAGLAGDRIEVSFADSGPGIAPEVLATIFEPFYTTKQNGTGLGLSISHSIIQQHNGTITARNAAGGGAVFTVCLPLAHPVYYR